VFSQWERGFKDASGKYVWIAEADDSSNPLFLESLMAKMSGDDEIVIGYTQSKTIDEHSKVLSDDVLFYTDEVNSEVFKTDFVKTGHDVIKNLLAVKNTIFNVSSVVFKNSSRLTELMQEAKMYRVAGDLRFYIDILKDGGKLCFIAESLNYHRRHSSSATQELDAQRHFDEICECQQYVADLYFDGNLPEAALAYRETVREYLFN
jgi:hypothetical protein